MYKVYLKMTDFFYIFALMYLASSASSESNYCKITSCQGAVHTACKFPLLKTSAKCGKVISSTLTPAEIAELLDAHNKIRAQVAAGKETRGINGPQPAATNLGPLEWDKELADIAQTWADQCDFNHDQCRDVERFQVGQNIAYSESSGSTDTKVASLVTMWDDEVKDFDPEGLKAFTGVEAAGKITGHYTQLVWAETKKVGCGAIRYENGSMTRTYLVCNYGPTGNMLGAPVYKTAA